MLAVNYMNVLPDTEFAYLSQVLDKSNTTGATSRAGTVYPSVATDFTPHFIFCKGEGCVAKSLV